MTCTHWSTTLLMLVAVGGVAAADAVSLIRGPDSPSPSPTGARIEPRPDGGWRVLPLKTTRHPGIEWRPTSPWNLAARTALQVRVANPTPEPIRISVRLDDVATLGAEPKLQRAATVPPRATGELAVVFTSRPYDTDHPQSLIGMRGWPGDWPVDRSSLVRCWVFGEARTSAVFEVLDVLALGSTTVIPTNRFFPFIDRFGQFLHADWPGKTLHEDDLVKSLLEERRELAAHPPPADRDDWGAWTGGPALSTGRFFRIERHDGRWWFVAPSGRLFWSLGVNCVRAEAPTPVTDREFYFADLPPSNSPFARFYGRSSWAPHGWYSNRTYRTYDFAAANLLRKHGQMWNEAWVDHTLDRLPSWGWTTIANWSAPEVTRRRRLPYTYNASFASPPIEGSHGYWGKFPDPFAAGFREGARRAMETATREGAVGDPWCLGFFIHNELGWGRPEDLGAAALRSPPTQPARTAAVARLRARHADDLARLNAAWRTTFDDWDRVVPPSPPMTAAASNDLAELTALIADQYFRVIAGEVRRAAPGQMYFGCRFAWVNELAIRAAAAHCDVISFNRYTWTLDDFRLPAGVDRPVIVGEFHFGALDRGPFHPGLRAAADQHDRAAKFQAYVRSALRHPNIVGVHWFQYRDQPTTGRGDGENYQIGLVDICDTPYPELRAASRALGAEMYRVRAGLQ